MSGRGWTKGRSLSSTFKEVREEREERERDREREGEERERERRKREKATIAGQPITPITETAIHIESNGL